MTVYHYVVVRADLPLGVQLAQTIHAAGESSTGNLPPDTHAVALHARDIHELHRTHQDLVRAGIPSVLICEPDAPHNGDAVAIGVKPCGRDLVRPVLRGLPLAFKEPK